MDFVEYISDRKFWKSEHRLLARKLGAKGLAEGMGIPTPKTICVTSSVEKLPQVNSGVYKANCGYSGKRVVAYHQGFDLLHREAITHDDIHRILDAPGQGPNDQYICEELITYNGELANDLKILSFNGVNAVIMFKHIASRRLAWYSLDWRRLPPIHPIHKCPYSNPDCEYPRPPQLAEALDWASRISKRLGTFIRVDFLVGDNGVYLGELTPTPNGGQNYTPFGRDLLSVYCQHLLPDSP